MPEAVIVSAARTPFGRAFKGSLKDVRPDDLAGQMIRAALDQVPALDPATIDDLQLGCAIPEGYQGGNLARTVAVKLGLDTVPGAPPSTLTIPCSMSTCHICPRSSSSRAWAAMSTSRSFPSCRSRMLTGMTPLRIYASLDVSASSTAGPKWERTTPSSSTANTASTGIGSAATAARTSTKNRRRIDLPR